MSKQIFSTFIINIIISGIGVILKINNYKTIGDIFLLISVFIFILFLILIIKKIKAH